MDKNVTIQEMNKFLKGVHMGGTIFKDYLEKAQSLKLQSEITRIIESFRKHEEVITKRIPDLGGNAADSVGIMGGMGQLLEKIKLLTADTDEEVLEHAIKAMEMGKKNANKFIKENKNLEESLLNDVKGVVKDYENHLRRLQGLW